MEHLAAKPLFYIGPMPVDSYMVTMFAITLFLALICFLATKNIQKSPGKLQNIVEMSVSGLNNFVADIMGPVKGRKFLPLLGTFFIFIFCSNYVGLLPFAGEVPGLASPTSTISVTATLAVLAFLATHISGFKYHKLHYFKHFITPFAFLLPLNIVEELVKPLSLSVRLYGNVYGDEAVIGTLFKMTHIGVPVLMSLLTVLLCLIQAFVFTLLTAIYIDGATSEIE